MDFGTYNAIVYNGNSVNDPAGIPAADSQASSWMVRQIAQDQQGASWFLRSQIGDTQPTFWDVTNTIANSAQPSWSLRSRVAASIQASWFMRMFATKALPSSWIVMGKVAHVLHIFWDKSSPKGPPSIKAGLSSPSRAKPAIIQSDTFATLTDEIN